MWIIQGGYGQQVNAPISGTTASKAARDGSTGAAKQQPPASSEKVTLSAKARELADKSAAADSQKVDSLRAAIQNGTFKIDHAAIANKIVDGE